MRILFYISTIKGGGAARVMTNLANCFANDSDLKAEVFLLTNFTADVEYTLSENVNRSYIEEKETSENRIKKNIRRCLALRRAIKKMNPDIVVSFMQENDVRNLVANIGLKNVKSVMSVRNDPQVLFSGWLRNRIFRFVYNHADGVVFQTEEARKWFGENFRPKSKVIINQTAEKFYNVKRFDSVKGIVTFGSYLPKKNHSLLIRAYAKIANDIKDDLYIYGNGTLEQDYKRLIDELKLTKRVHLCGVTDHPETILASSKLFVLSSDHEGMPNVLLEALASGIPCISTDCPCGGPKAVIDNMENGILVPTNDVDALADAMRLVLLNEDLQNKLGLQAKERALRFKPDVVYDEWKDFFNEIMCSR